MASALSDEKFLTEWNAMPRSERLRMRRLVRLGRPFPDRKEAALAAGYARFQSARIWTRYFWVWFVPGLLLALGVAASIHPAVLGAVIALAGQAVFANRNLKKVARGASPSVV